MFKLCKHAELMLLFTVTVIIGMPAQTRADSLDYAKVAKVKSAYLLNFIKFTQWPEQKHADKDSPIIICVLGEDRLGSVLDQTMQDKIVNDRSILIHRIDVSANDRRISQLLQRHQEQLRKSHVVFIGVSLKTHVQKVLNTLENADTLTVSDIPSFVKEGGMLELALSNNRIVFHANRKAVSNSNVKSSSKLLRLAKRIE